MGDTNGLDSLTADSTIESLNQWRTLEVELFEQLKPLHPLLWDIVLKVTSGGNHYPNHTFVIHEIKRCSKTKVTKIIGTANPGIVKPFNVVGSGEFSHHFEVDVEQLSQNSLGRGNPLSNSRLIQLKIRDDVLKTLLQDVESQEEIEIPVVSILDYYSKLLNSPERT